MHSTAIDQYVIISDVSASRVVWRNAVLNFTSIKRSQAPIPCTSYTPSLILPDYRPAHCDY